MQISTLPDETSARADGHRNQWHRFAPTSGNCTISGGEDLAAIRTVHHTPVFSIRLAANSARRRHASGLDQDTTERIHR